MTPNYEEQIQKETEKAAKLVRMAIMSYIRQNLAYHHEDVDGFIKVKKRITFNVDNFMKWLFTKKNEYVAEKDGSKTYSYSTAMKVADYLLNYTTYPTEFNFITRYDKTNNYKYQAWLIYINNGKGLYELK